MTGEADEALVVRSRRGDRAAFEELVRRSARLLFAHLYLKTRDVHKTEDLVQETYLLAWRSIADLDDPKTFRAWLTTIANSAFVDVMRRDSRKKRGSDSRRGARSPHCTSREPLCQVARSSDLVHRASLRFRSTMRFCGAVPFWGIAYAREVRQTLPA